MERKIEEALGLPFVCSEPAQIQRYCVGNEFKAHTDDFDPELDASYWSGGQRTWTFMVYVHTI